MEREHELQNAIRVYVSKLKLGTLFRANVGSGWTGKSRREGNKVIIENPRRLNTGLPSGFPDLFGFRTITITPDMVGQRIAVFCGLEIKTKLGRVRDDQMAMLKYLQECNCRAGIARSTSDAEEILSGKHGRI
jgi:hypothetical protein